ncbi:MAG: LysE family translocator [Pseudomonadota bacterium]
MSVEIWLAYTLAATILLAIPGPTILLVVSQSLGQGRRVVPSAVAGVTLGDATAMIVSLLGLGALLATSATLFQLFKWVGVAYLIYLAWRMWQGARHVSLPTLGGASQAPIAKAKIFRDAFVVTALNPKSIVFFVAFLPQFVDPAQAAWPQLLILGSTFLVLAAINTALYGYLAGWLRQRLKSRSLLAGAQRVGAGFLFSAGLLTAAWSRSN